MRGSGADSSGRAMALRFTEPVEIGLGGVRVHGSGIAREFDEHRATFEVPVGER